MNNFKGFFPDANASKEEVESYKQKAELVFEGKDGETHIIEGTLVLCPTNRNQVPPPVSLRLPIILPGSLDMEFDPLDQPDAE